jgi:tRNA 2-selenouridine synthase
MPRGWRPLVYCWRGGQRSGSFASILSQIGWRVETLAGGYKAWRRLVVTACYDTPVAAPVVVLDGDTGTAKTALLALIAGAGCQVLDLEGLANHRGSLFGARGPQPTQAAFEGRIAMALAALDPARPLVVEAESAAIGQLRLPPRLWRAMVAAPRVVVRAPLAARAEYLARAYGDLAADPGRLDARILALAPMHPRDVIAAWRAMAAAGDFAGLAEGLMARHYDPRYARHRARMPAAVAEVAADSLDDAELPALARRVAAAVQGAAV